MFVFVCFVLFSSPPLSHSLFRLIFPHRLPPTLPFLSFLTLLPPFFFSYFEIFLDEQIEQITSTDYSYTVIRHIFFKNTYSVFKDETIFSFPMYKIFSLSLYFVLYQISIGDLISLDIIPPSSDDGSLEPKRYSVDFISQ